ncbi:hypothetical protein [Thermococcus sp.]|uniref:hypothetical protein n=1 Tax=Thermococcus sp. TaxID=35749 RepID=UPI002627C8A9|nr:hypothetical protein [Thermococcus sp.]
MGFWGEQFLALLILTVLVGVPFSVASSSLESYFPAVDELSALGLQGAKMHDHQSFGSYETRYYLAHYGSGDWMEITLYIKKGSSAVLSGGANTQGSKCTHSERTIECTYSGPNDVAWLDEKLWSYKYFSSYYAQTVIGGKSDGGDPPTFWGNVDEVVQIEVKIRALYNVSNPAPIVGRALMNLMVSKVSSNATSTSSTTTSTTTTTGNAKLTIAAPVEGQRFTSSSGFGLFVIGVKAKVSESNAKDLYAVITSPDGSRSRARVYSDGTIDDLVIVENTGLSTPKKGTVKVEVYGTIDSKEMLLASGSVGITLANDEEKPGDMIDNDGDGLVDCDDPDIATCDECVYEKKLEWAESIMKRHINYLEKVKSLHPGYTSLYNVYEDDLREIHDRNIKDPDKMVEEMNAYMDKKVYGQQRIKTLLSIFANDPEKRYQLRQIAEKYRYDPVARDVEMENFIYKYAKNEAEKAAITNLILTGILQPPKWLVGGQYNSGGVLDWSKFVADNFEKVGNTVKLKGADKVKFFTTPAGVYMVALDAKALLDHANDLKNMNLPNNAKVSIIVLDGATKIGKLLDPTGYFGNMADATVGAVINLRKKIEERNQGWILWNGYVLHETSIPGIYEDYETGKKFKRVGGGWFRMNFVEVGSNG